MIIWRIFAANKQRNANLKTYMDMKKLKTLLTIDRKSVGRERVC